MIETGRAELHRAVWMSNRKLPTLCLVWKRYFYSGRKVPRYTRQPKRENRPNNRHTECIPSQINLQGSSNGRFVVNDRQVKIESEIGVPVEEAFHHQFIVPRFGRGRQESRGWQLEFKIPGVCRVGRQWERLRAVDFGLSYGRRIPVRIARACRRDD